MIFKFKMRVEDPIAYASRTLTPAERNYPLFEQEALGVVWVFQQFRTYLIGHKTTVITDHASLQYIPKKNNQSPRIARWGLAQHDLTYVEFVFNSDLYFMR